MSKKLKKDLNNLRKLEKSKCKITKAVAKEACRIIDELLEEIEQEIWMKNYQRVLRERN